MQNLLFCWPRCPVLDCRYDPTQEFPVTVDFNANGFFMEGTDPPSVAGMLVVMQAGNYMNYIENYVWMVPMKTFSLKPCPWGMQQELGMSDEATKDGSHLLVHLVSPPIPLSLILMDQPGYLSRCCKQTHISLG